MRYFSIFYSLFFTILAMAQSGTEPCDPPEIFADLTKQIEALNKTNQLTDSDRYKNWDKLHRYYQCFKNQNSTLDAKDLKAIELAASHFGIPYQLLFCTLMQESRFVSKAKSSVGAQGIAQFMPTTLQYLSNLHRKPSQQVFDRCKKYFTQLDGQNKTYCRTIMDRMDYYESWKVLNKSFRSNHLTEEDLTYNADDRMASIALSAFFLKHLLKMVARYYNENSESPYTIEIETYKLVMAAYNAGPGRVSRTLAELDGSKDKQKALAILRKISETKDHMDGIEHCMSKGDGHAPTAIERKGGNVCSGSV